MRRIVRGARRQPAIGLMILPMIDVIFLLLLFFVVVTSFEASAKIAVDVPRPDESQARRGELAKQVVVNCEYQDPTAPNSVGVLYRLGADSPESLRGIAARLSAAKLANPQLTVVVRGDRRLPNVKMREVVRMVAESGIDTMNVAVRMDAEP